MSATIDHLEAHHGIMVIRGFIDARGVSVPVGASGVVRMLNLDSAAQESTGNAMASRNV